MYPTDAEIAQEIAAIRAAPSWRLSHFCERFLIRAGRVALGAAIGALGCWFAAIAWGMLATPFAAQSLIGLVSGVALGWLALAVLAGAWGTAFGAAPTIGEEDQRLRERAAERVQQHYADAARVPPSADRTAWSYRAGRALSRALCHW